ncbi:MAG: hypothetical protein ACE5JI_03755 [Acidobacteriota bacterium]
MSYKFELYTKLQKETPQINAEFREAARELELTDEEKLQLGCTGAVSGCPALIRKDVAKAMEDVNRVVKGCASLQHEIRMIVKDVYGDEYDACPVNTCEAALSVVFDQLVAPPMMTRGDRYQGRYIAPYERHVHHQAGYGVPFPAKYKDLVSERGETSGEAGMAAKHQQNLATVLVPLEGASYDCHGIKYYPAPLLMNVEPEASRPIFEKTAQRHAPFLTGIASLAYDTPGYGYGVKDEDGTPKLQKLLARIAHDYNVPYIVDNAWGIPFVGADPRKIGCDVMLYSMDKASGSPTAGLIIGTEEPMVQLRRALGMHGARYGTTASYGKAQWVTIDAGKEMLAGMIQALKVCRDRPKIMTEPVDECYEIVAAEFGKIDEKIHRYFKIAKSYNSQAVEVNYQASWDEPGKPGIPIFTIEDMYAGSNLLQSTVMQAGILPTIAYDGNIFFSPGLGTLDEEGRLIPDRMRKVVRAMVILLEVISKHAELI